MMENEGYLTCGVTIEWTNSQGLIVRKINYCIATCRLIRNSLCQLLVEIQTKKLNSIVKLYLQEILIFNRFMGDGKAAIKFKHEKCTLYLSNAPVTQLVNFLKTIFIKLNDKNNDKSFTDLIKKKLLDNKLDNDICIQDVSSVTITEINRAKEKVAIISQGTITTPSPMNIQKRKYIPEISTYIFTKIPKTKKLFNNSTLLETTEEQSQILKCVLNGKNIFFTGSAGTGKSFLLKKIISVLPPDVTIVTASTGVAACHIGGITLHQFAGIGLGIGTISRCRQMVSKSTTGAIWKRTKHLIIDEISMVDGDYFDKIESVARFIKNSKKPFGGIQLILCGDFFQLPPVSKKNKKVKFCFQSETWTKCIHVNFELRTVYRQTDSKFINMLNKLRIGQVTDEITEVLRSTSKQKIEKDGILATRLCSHINEANDINECQLNKLPGNLKVYVAQDSDESMIQILDQQLPVSSKLILKVGAQVMLVKNLNINEGLVNGARGVVVKFEDEIPIVYFRVGSNYKVKMEKWSIKLSDGAVVFRKQIPLKLAWAFSIHKSQGLTLDCVEMSLARVFDAGQAYVALSRVQSLQMLRVIDFNTHQIWANKEVLNFYKKFQKQIEQMKSVPLGKKSIFIR